MGIQANAENLPPCQRLPDAGDDNLNRGIEGNRPGIGPQPFEPNWTFRNDGELTDEEIEELRKALEEAEAER